MITDTPEITSLLIQKFQAFYELFTEFSHNAAELHGTLPVHDDASRAVFNSLSRINAFTEQMNLLVRLMREDVRVIEELTGDQANVPWNEQMERCFYEWLRASRTAAPNVN